MGGPNAGYPPQGPNKFPQLTPNSFLPSVPNMEPPGMNYGPGMMPPPPYPLPGQSSLMGPPPPYYDPGMYGYAPRYPVRVCRRTRRSRRCRPVVRIIESSSCSSTSSCSSVSSCSRHRHHTRSRSRRCAPAAPQQPIILLPVPCQQPQSGAITPGQVQGQLQTQQIILPPLQVNSLGQIQQQLPQNMSMQPISIQQQPQRAIPLPPLQLSGSNVIQSTASSPVMISRGQPMLQPSISMPQIANIVQSQQLKSGSVQYVQAVPQPSSALHYISSETRSAVAPQRVLVNSTKRKQSTRAKPTYRSNSVREVPQNDLKFGRRPFDWYDSDRKKNIIDEKVQVGQRGGASIR